MGTAKREVVLNGAKCVKAVESFFKDIKDGWKQAVERLRELQVSIKY